MLDNRKSFDGIFNFGARILHKIGFTPNGVTLLGLVLGVSASVALYYEALILSALLLWISGYFDATDGAMARMYGEKTPQGTLFDIMSDRIVELLLILVIGLKHPQSNFVMLLLTCAIVLSLSTFFMSGVLIKNTTRKSFFYQHGLIERTEGFIFFTFLILFPSQINTIGGIYAFLILVTAVQRFFLTMKMVGEEA